ncbi:MAG: hypothetical protein KC731_14535 [Myxococcales bacterium]|nr:hypothetical protein [Myxococcales bacterium]
MGSIVERMVLEALETRGWTVSETKRDGEDVEAPVAFRGDVGRVRFVHDGQSREEPWSGPCSVGFVRLDLGEPDDAPDHYGVTVEELPSADPEQSRPRFVTQVAIGPGWASVGAGVVGADERDLWEMSVRRLVAQIELLRPGREADARRGDLEAILHRGAAPPRLWSKRRALVVVVGALVAAIGWWFGAWPMELLGILGAAGTLVHGGLLVVADRADQRIHRRRHRERWGPVAGALLGGGPFDASKDLPGRAEEVLLPIVGEAPESDPMIWRGPDSTSRRRAWTSATASMRAQASSKAHELVAEVELAWVDWETTSPFHLSTLDVCRILPTRSLVVSLFGPEQVLGGLPAGPRETRGADGVRWVFVDAELEELLPQHFAGVARSLGLTRETPYRGGASPRRRPDRSLRALPKANEP